MEKIKELYRTATASVNALPMSNYFDVDGGFKKEIKDWKYAYQEAFDFDKALRAEPDTAIRLPFMGELHGYGKPWYANDRTCFLIFLRRFWEQRPARSSSTKKTSSSTKTNTFCRSKA